MLGIQSATTETADSPAPEVERPTRRIITGKKREMMGAPAILRGLTLDELADIGNSIMGAELQRFKLKVSKGAPLTSEEARIVQGYNKAVSDLRKDERAAKREASLENLSDDELKDLALKVIGKKK